VDRRTSRGIVRRAGDRSCRSDAITRGGGTLPFWAADTRDPGAAAARATPPVIRTAATALRLVICAFSGQRASCTVYARGIRRITQGKPERAHGFVSDWRILISAQRAARCARSCRAVLRRGMPTCECAPPRGQLTRSALRVEESRGGIANGSARLTVRDHRARTNTFRGKLQSRQAGFPFACMPQGMAPGFAASGPPV
jgi:hypothetical protein